LLLLKTNYLQLQIEIKGVNCLPIIAIIYKYIVFYFPLWIFLVLSFTKDTNEEQRLAESCHMSKISFYSSPGNVRERCQLYTNSVLRKYLKVKINAYFRYINKFVFLSAFLFEKNNWLRAVMFGICNSIWSVVPSRACLCRIS
jgi:hypothetical protein